MTRSTGKQPEKNDAAHRQVKVLIESLPYIARFSGKIVVVKYGGGAMGKEDCRRAFAEDMVLMKHVGIHPVVVHGGGPHINKLLQRLGQESRFVRGVRVTDQETMEVVEMVLGGAVNQEIVSLINHSGGRAVGLTGKDGGLILARKRADVGPEGEDFGQAGEVQSVQRGLLQLLIEGGFIPVIAPVAAGADGLAYNINADTVAGSLAAALEAEKLVILSDVAGVLDQQGEPISRLDVAGVRALLASGVVERGMIPKLEALLEAVQQGVRSAHVIDGQVPHATLLELFTDLGIGTLISAS